MATTTDPLVENATVLVIEDHPILGFVSPFVGRQLTFPYQSRVLRALRWLMRRIY